NVHVTNVNHNETVVVTAKQLAKAKGMPTVPVDSAAKAQVRQNAQQIQAVAQQRQKEEVAPAGGKVSQPHVATLNVPKATPLPAKTAQAMSAARAAPVSPGSHGKQAVAKEQPPATGVKPAAFSTPAPRAPDHPTVQHPAETRQPLPGQGPDNP